MAFVSVYAYNWQRQCRADTRTTYSLLSDQHTTEHVQRPHAGPALKVQSPYASSHTHAQVQALHTAADFKQLDS
jgi:hypothetical protein